MKFKFDQRRLLKITLVLLGFLLTFFLTGRETSSPTSLLIPTPVVTEEPTPMPTQEPVLRPTPILPSQSTPGVKGEVLVVRVIDGDTIEIEGGKKVRYIGIDTPETVDPRKPVQCFGYEASNKNKELIEGKKVRLEKDISEIDKYGRLLRYVWVEDLFVNDYLVRQGYAYSYTYPPDVKHQEQFRQAQQEAMANKRGLWASCPVQHEQPTLKITTPTPLSQSIVQ